MRIAFSTLACPDWTIEQVTDAAVRYGYDGLEWRLADGNLLGPRTPDTVWDRIAAACASHGLSVACLDTSCVFVRQTDEERQDVIADAVAMSERATLMSSPAIRVFAGAIPGGVRREDALGPAREALAEAASRAAVEICVETHDAWSRAADVAELTRGVQGVAVLWDVAHTHRAGESPRASIAAMGKPPVVHIKDARGDELLPLGEGDVPVEWVLGELAMLGFDGWLSFEWEKLWHPELAAADEALPRAARYLRDLVERAS